jgi:hypothetical protein
MTTFDAASALKQARAIAYPRLVGSQGEKQAAGYIRRQLERLGYRVCEESFPIGHTPWGFSRLCLALGLVMLFLSWISYRRWPGLAFGLLLGLLLLQHFSTKGWLWLARRQSGCQESGSKNIIAGFPPSADKPSLIVYLVAHYDSKSQTISLPMRIFWLMSALTAVSVLLAGLGFRFSGFSLDIKPRLWFIIAALAVVRLFIVSTQNKSSGGLDNAGSVGVVLELARVFSRQPPVGTEIRYLFTGAEEWGLLGASHYAARHAGEWERKGVYFVNLDGVGIGGRLALLGHNDPGLTKGLVKMAQQQGIGLRRFGLLPGLLVDHIPFARKDFPTVTLACVAIKSLLIHTCHDTISLVDTVGLGEAGRLLESWIRCLVKEPPEYKAEI